MIILPPTEVTEYGEADQIQALAKHLPEAIIEAVQSRPVATEGPGQEDVRGGSTTSAPEDPAAFFAFAMERGWSDGLPVLPPTPDAVRRAVSASGRDGADVVAELPPRWGDATVEVLAANAVMAGCLPEYMPVVLAAVQAIAHPDFNMHGIQCTTNPVSPLLVVNGPIRTLLDIAGGRGCLGPGFRANATIGRALRLVMQNVGGGIPVEIDKATHGMPGKFTMCFGELEEESPWAPLHVDRGYARDDSTVTAIGVQGTTNILPMLKQAESILTWIADALGTMGVNNVLLGEGNAVVVLPPGHAHLLTSQGYDKSRVQAFLFERSKIPLSAYPPEGNIPMGHWVIDGDYVRIVQRPEDILILCAGAPEPYHVVIMPTFGHTRAITVPIVGPA